MKGLQMSSNLKVSIITVVYNGAKTIEQTIKSVLSQKYPNIEYIIVDGMSNDGTKEIINKYRKNVDCFISEEDKGIYDAMNKGIKHSTGDIIGFINSDDWYALDVVEKVVQTFLREEVDVVYGEVKMVHFGGHMSLVKNGTLEDIIFRMVIPHPTAFVKRQIFEKIGLYNQKYRIAADYDLFLRMYLNGIRMKQIKQVLAYVREGGVSTVNLTECANEFREIAKHYAQINNDFSTLDRIEQDYQVRIKRIQTKEKAYQIVKSGKSIEVAINEIKGGRNKAINILGAGNLGIECFLFLQKMKIAVECFWDNDERKWNTNLLDKPIHQCVNKEQNVNYIVVAVLNYQEEIIEQLEDMGYQRDKDFCTYFDLINKIENIIDL